jgi:lysozyme
MGSRLHLKIKTKKGRRLLLLAVAVLASALALWVIVHSVREERRGNERNIQPDWTYLSAAEGIPVYQDPTGKTAARWGVDVSTYQGNIDFAQLKNAGVEFAILRLGYRSSQEGILNLDDTFTRNAAGAAAAGMPIGVYFYSQAITQDEAEEEAAFVLENIRGLSLAYPVVYDQEEFTQDVARTDGLTGEQATANALAFCKRVEAAGYTPMIYMNEDWSVNMYDLEQIDQYLIWYADYGEEPSPASGFAMWQYSCIGSVVGIGSTHVDLDLWFYPVEK